MVIAEPETIANPDKPGGSEAVLRALPPERFPRVIEAAGPLSAPQDPERFYDLVIELILAGIESAAAKRRETA